MTAWALRGAFASVFILFLLAGFNLEGNGVARSWWAVNVNGVTVETRAHTAAAPIEAGGVLRYRHCDKMQETLSMRFFGTEIIIGTKKGGSLPLV